MCPEGQYLVISRVFTAMTQESLSEARIHLTKCGKSIFATKLTKLVNQTSNQAWWKKVVTLKRIQGEHMTGKAFTLCL